LGFYIENPLVCRILQVMNGPRFSELNKVSVNDGENPPYDGYVIESQLKDSLWFYMPVSVHTF